jgi:hypothetical protein
MTTYTYDSVVTYDPGSNTLIRNAVGNLYDPTDTAFATPLSVTDLSGNTLTAITSNDSGITPQFKSTLSRMVWKAGTFPPISIGSPQMYVDAATAAQAAAEAAEAAAEAAADAAVGPGSSVVATVLADPTSTARVQIDDLYAPRVTRTKHAPAFGLYFPEAEGATFNNTTSDHLALIAAANVAAAAGSGAYVHLPIGKTAYVSSPWVVPANVQIDGHYGSSTIRTDQNIGMIQPSGGGVKVRGVTFQGSLTPGTSGSSGLASQMGIFYSGTVATRLQGLTVENCRFINLHSVGVQIIHGANITVRDCLFDQYAWGGVWLTSVIGGSVSHNVLNGTGLLYLGTNFCYGVTCTTSIVGGTIDDTVNPRSQQITIDDNIVTNQAWECLDTHLGQEIKFADNQCYGPGAGVTAIGNDNAPMFSPIDITITGNTIVCPLTVDSYGGVALIGAKIILDGGGAVTNPGRQLATGNVMGNDLNGVYHDAQVASGALNVSNARGVPIIGNTLKNCRSVGIYLRNTPDAVCIANTITDMWRSDAGSAAFYILRDTQDPGFTVTLTANRHLRGDLSSGSYSNINTVSIGGSSDAAIVLNLSQNLLPGTINSTQSRSLISPNLFIKTATDLTVNNSATLTASGLTLPVEANATYEVTGFVTYNTSQTADAVIGWTVPTGATMGWTPDSLFVSSTSASGSVYRTLANAAQTGILGGPGAANGVAQPHGTLVTGSTAGNLTLTFAQSTAEVSNTVLLTGSWLKLTKIA